MEPDEPLQNYRPPLGIDRKVSGLLLIIFGIVGGGIWTFAVALGEQIKQGGLYSGDARIDYYGALLTGLASVCVIVAGVLLVVASNYLSADVIAKGKTLGITGLLLAAAAAAYIVGFVVCQAGA